MHRTRKAGLGWASAVAIGTAALLTTMGLPVQAQAQMGDARIDLGGEAATSRTLILPRGKAAVVELPRAASDILVSDPNVVEAVIRTPRRVYVMARGTGQANAFFFDAQERQILNLEIRVEQDADVIEDLIAKLLPTARVTVETMGDGVALYGTADSAADAERAVEIATRFAAAGALAGGGGGEGGGGGGGAQSSVEAPALAPVMNMISVREAGQVMLKVRILEMQRRLVRQMGIDLNGVVEIDGAAEVFDFATQTGFNGGGALSGVLDTDGVSELTNLDLALDAFERNGLVKTLAEPSLIALSGQEAEFFAGGEVGFQVIQPASVGNAPLVVAEFRRFGIELKFQPTVRSKGSINMVLATSVSEVSEALGTASIPGFLTRAATTTIDLPSGASFAIAGLLQENIEEAIVGVPGAKDVPVLGQLFRSQEFARDETELVIIATPYLVEPTTLAELTDPGEGFVPPTALEQVLLGRLEAAYGVNSRGVGEASLQGPLGFILD